MKLKWLSRHSPSVTQVWIPARSAEADITLDVAQLHDEYAEFVWRNLQRLGVRPSELEDALQDVFMVVHRRLDSFDGSSKFSTWLFGISLRVASSYRKRAYLKHEQGNLDLYEPVDENPLADPEEQAQRREAERQLQVSLESMPLDRRAVFVMFELEGLPTSAIADILGIPQGTVHSRLHKARLEFTESIAHQDTTRKVGGVP